MHWILQENCFRHDEWEKLIDTLNALKISFTCHKVIPFIGELTSKPEGLTGNVVCLGSYSMRHSAKQFGWVPGVFDLFEQNFLVQRQHWGDLMLNTDSEIVKLKDAHLTKAAFVRPIDDSKYFAGAVFDASEFNEWVHKIIVLGDNYVNSLTGETEIQICVPKTIFSEYRFWIVDSKIVTSSLYKRGRRVVYDSHVDEHITRFVQTILDIGWMPDRAFVIDVCETPDGLKIVEINTINSAGFYAGDLSKIVNAIDSMTFGT